jgi:RecA-family ATPase
MRHRVQPLKEREHLGFEYSGVEDPSRMVPTLELTKEEVLERLRKVLKGGPLSPTQFLNIVEIIRPLL